MATTVELNQSEEIGTLKRKVDAINVVDNDRAKRRPENGDVGRPAGYGFRSASAASEESQESAHPGSKAGNTRHFPPGFVAPEIPHVLSHGKVFPIQIGKELFQLSGASISSDAPSYFSNFFEKQLRESPDQPVRTLYIDRDPDTFRDIVLHLQGYAARPRDSSHFARLIMDAQFYALPRLVEMLYEADIMISIGGQEFAIPRDLFSGPGDSPNFFSLGFGIFFTSPVDAFPGVPPAMPLLRPPSLTPPTVANRSAAVFEDLLTLLRGYKLHIRDEEHRAMLIRDCKYFHLRGLEQRLVKHAIHVDPLTDREQIIIRLEDIKPTGLSCDPGSGDGKQPGWLRYARPYADTTTRDLIVEVTCESMLIDLDKGAAVAKSTAMTKLHSLFSSVCKTMKWPAPTAQGRYAIRANSNSIVCVNGEDVTLPVEGLSYPWTVQRGQFAIHIRKATSGSELVLLPILLEATSTTRESVKQRGFLD